MSEAEVRGLLDGLANATPGGWSMVKYDSRFLVTSQTQPWPPVASVGRAADAAFIVRVRQHLRTFVLFEQSLWEIVRAVAASDPVVWNDGEPHCLFECAGHVDVTSIGTPYYAHSPGCAYVKALELTSDVEEGTEDGRETRTDAQREHRENVATDG